MPVLKASGFSGDGRWWLLAGAALLFAMLFLASQTRGGPRIVILGDSTAAEHAPRTAPMSGWGRALAQMLRGTRSVVNLARSGESARSYYRDVWPAVRRKLEPSDLVLIQFGHNDPATDRDRFGAPFEGFARHLELLVGELRTSGARPVLLSPIAKHRFRSGHVEPAHGQYPEAVRQTAARLGVPFIDLTARTERMLEALGPDRTRAWFMIGHDGVDAAHLTETGAGIVAALVVEELRRLAAQDPAMSDLRDLPAVTAPPVPAIEP